MRCPVCGSHETGRVAVDQYFCWRCAVEFHGQPGRWRVYRVDEEGNLVAWQAGPPEPADAAEGRPRAALSVREA